MIAMCPVCGKKFDVLWPQLYRYRRDGKYLCSYQCMVQYDRKEGKEMTKISPEQKRKAIEIALEGGDPKPFLKECGSKNPDNLWYWMKNKLKIEEPETYEMLAKGGRPKPIAGGEWEKMETPEGSLAGAMAGMKDATDEFFGKCKDMGLKLEKPEIDLKIKSEDLAKTDYPDPVIMDPPFEYKVTGIETAVGDFQYSRRYGYLDWTPDGVSDTVSLKVEEWKELMRLLPLIAKELGVEL